MYKRIQYSTIKEKKSINDSESLYQNNKAACHEGKCGFIAMFSCYVTLGAIKLGVVLFALMIITGGTVYLSPTISLCNTSLKIYSLL